MGFRPCPQAHGGRKHPTARTPLFAGIAPTLAPKAPFRSNRRFGIELNLSASAPSGVEGYAEGGTMRRLPSNRSPLSATSRSEMQFRVRVLVEFAGGRLNPHCVVVIAPTIAPSRRAPVTRPPVVSTDCGNRHPLPAGALVAPRNHARGQCQGSREIKEAVEADNAQKRTANDGRTCPAKAYADSQDGRRCRTPWQVNQLLTEKI